MSEKKITIIGGGLAGVEAAYQAAKRGVDVELYEMRPGTATGAHETGFLGELVCSNSLGSNQVTSASGLLKEELTMLDSFFLRMAEKNKVPAGSSLSVDRVTLAEAVTREIEAMSNVTVIKEEIKELPRVDHPLIIATGPLTSPDFARNITSLTMRKNLFFYDATSPIIDASSIDMDKVYLASRYDKGEADFINIPLDEEQYNTFVKELVEAGKTDLSEVDKDLFFEACLPIEEIARRGAQTLAFGPLKPVGLNDPKTGAMPHAVIQLRQDNLRKTFYQMVGFQTRLKYGEQKRIFRALPGLEKAEFERYGRMHRNTYVNAPLIIDKFYRCKQKENIYFAGQICGVEGYVESISAGLLAGLFAAKSVLKEAVYNLPETTACGSLVHYVSQADWKDFRPTKFTFGLLPEVPVKGRRRGGKKLKKELKASRALEHLETWRQKTGI